MSLHTENHMQLPAIRRYFLIEVVKMRRIISLICLLMILSCALTLTTFAQTDDFYYNWGDNPLFDELWDENNTKNQNILNIHAKEYLIAKQFVEEDKYDPAKLSFDLEHTVCQINGWSAQQVVEYINGNCDPLFIKNNFSYSYIAYFVPFNYEGVETTNYLSCWYSPDNNRYFSSYDSTKIRMPDINLMIYSSEKLVKYFEENNLSGYQPKQCIYYKDMIFIICQIEGEYRLVYIPTKTTYEIVYGNDPNKKFDFTNEPVFTTERFKTVFSAYEQQLSNASNMVGTAGVQFKNTAQEEPLPPDFTFLWIIGGMVLLVGGIVTIVLVKKKKA